MCVRARSRLLWRTVFEGGCGSELGQFAGVEHVAGPEILTGPLHAGGELDADEVANFAKDAPADGGFEDSLGVGEAEFRLERQWAIKLDAGAVRRDVFEVRHEFAVFAVAVFPFDGYQVRTEDAWLAAPVLHNLTHMIGSL